MADEQERVILSDPDVIHGTPVFRGTRVPFQACGIISEEEKLWMSFWASFRVRINKVRSPRWKRLERRCFYNYEMV